MLSEWKLIGLISAVAAVLWSPSVHGGWSQTRVKVIVPAPPGGAGDIVARAFFYAGARVLLVSHWKVDSAAATRLTTTTFSKLKHNPQLGRAEALRQAMLDYLNDSSDPLNTDRIGFQSNGKLRILHTNRRVYSFCLRPRAMHAVLNRPLTH
jgi:hypothetical protein